MEHLLLAMVSWNMVSALTWLHPMAWYVDATNMSRKSARQRVPQKYRVCTLA